jgi:glycerol uptake facilitator-like aquaporin
LARKAFAELIGSALLASAVVGSGIAAQRLSPRDTGLQLLENSAATGAVLVALILALAPVSAAFNPAVTLAERALGAITTRAAGLFVVAQVVGCCVGVMLANLMFELSAIDVSSHRRSSGALWLAEVVATFGLLLVIFGVVRAGRSSAVPYAVGTYIAAAYWFTSSTSFANPAVTVARMFSDTFAGISPGSVPGFVLMQLVGGVLAIALVTYLFPPLRTLTE